MVVIGGGDTAIDAARVSKRLGADVTILYRRTRAEMPAIKPEIEGALEEGVAIEFLAAPGRDPRRRRTGRGRKCIRMDLGAPDASGRPRPVPRAGSRVRDPGDHDHRGHQPGARFDGLDGVREGKDWIKVDDAARYAAWTGVYAGGDDIGTRLGDASPSDKDALPPKRSMRA